MDTMTGAISTIILAGEPARARLLDGLTRRIEAAGSPVISLATVLVGDDGPSRRYVASKHKTAQSIGIGWPCRIIRLMASWFRK